MAPKQCPTCGRFLKNELVRSLVDGDQPCPGCSEPLTAAALGVESAASGDTPGGSGAGADTTEPDSVRPPDLAPGDVRDDASDVLEGWDRGATPEEIASWNVDRAPFPTDTVAVVAGGTVGALVGALLRGHRIRGAVLGGLAGLLGVASARRIWRLPAD